MAKHEFACLPVNRQDAKASGSKQYYTGNNCPHGHDAPRWTRNGECLECGRARARINVPKWVARQPPEKIREKNRVRAHAAYIKNPERFRANSRRARAKDPEKYNASTKVWRQKNREHVTQYDNVYKKARYHANLERSRLKSRLAALRRRALAMAAGGSFTKEDVARMLVEQDGCCKGCQRNIRLRYEVDHIVPLIRGGSNDPVNLQLLCRSCNARKNARTMEEWLQLNETGDCNEPTYQG